jgi:parallel beta-helix repeat protein
VAWDKASGIPEPTYQFDPETGSGKVLVTRDVAKSSSVNTHHSDEGETSRATKLGSNLIIVTLVVSVLTLVTMGSYARSSIGISAVLIILIAICICVPSSLHADEPIVITIDFPNDIRYKITSETITEIVIGLEVRTEAIVLQNGRDGYSDQTEVTISTLYLADWNENNGITFYNADTNVVNSTSELRTLMKFDNLENILPEGMFVASATLELTFISGTRGGIVEGHYLTTSWNSTAKEIGWRYRNNLKEEWTVPGGLGDVVADTSFVTDTIGDSGFITNSIQLDSSIIQSWITNSSSNHGIILSNRTPYRANIVPHNSVLVGKRPRLTIYAQFFEPKPLEYPLVTHTVPLLIHVQANTKDMGCTEECGDDITGSGAKNAPFATIAKALTEAESGDIILLRDGVHRGGVSVVKPRITIQSYPDEWATIAAPITDPNIGINVYLRLESSGSVLKNLELFGGHYYSIRMESTVDWGNGKLEGASNILIDNCKIHSSGYNLFKIDSLCSNITIQNSELYLAGIRTRNSGSAISLYDTVNVVIRDNYIHDCYGAGIMVKAGARNTLIERNLIENTYSSGVYVGFYEEAEYMNARGNNPTYFQAIDTVIRNNIISRTVGAGIGVYSSKNATIVFNTLTGTAYANQAAILVNIVQTYVNTSYSPLTPCEDLTIRNNIITSTTDRIFEIRTLADWESGIVVGALKGQMNLGNNLYYSYVTSHGLFTDQRSGNYTYLGQFSGWSSRHSESQSTETNPGLNKKFIPPKDSPAVGGGSFISGITTDFHARPIISSKVTIGAVQFIDDESDVPIMRPFPPLPLLSSRGGFNKNPPSAVFIPLAATSRRVYVSPDGNDDSGNGTISNPFKTLRKAIYPGVIQENDVIVLFAGTYQGGVSITQRNVTIQTMEGDSPAVISCPTTDMYTCGSLITFIQPFSSIRNVELIGGYWYGIQVDADDVTIDNVKIHDIGSDCVKISPFFHRATIKHSEIYKCGVRTTYNAHNPSDGSAGYDAIRGVDNNDIVISQNYIHDTDGTCIKTQGGSLRSLIERNLIMNCGSLGITAGFYEEAIWMNFIENPDYYESIDAVIKNNIIVNVQGAGVGLYAAKNPRVLHNTMVNVALTMQVPILIVASPHVLSTVDKVGQSCANITILNNIVQLSEAGLAQGIIEIRVQDDNGLKPGSALKVDNNIYFSNYQNYHGNVVSDLEFLDRRLSSYMRGGFDDWKAVGYDSESSISDPLFTTDYNLNQGSPAIGSAHLLSDASEDYFGNKRTGPNTDSGACLSTSNPDNQSFPPPIHTIRKVLVSDCTPFVTATTLYVSATDGTDGSNCEGTISKPFKSINRAVSVAAANSTIILRSGRFNESTTIIQPGITVKTHDSDAERALIVAPLYSPNSLHGFQFTSSAAGGRLSRLEILGGYFYTIKVDADDVTVDNCKIHSCGSQCIQLLKADRFTLSRSEIFDAGMREPSNGDGIQNFVSHSMVVKDSYIHDVPSDGIKLEGGAKNAVIERNVIAVASRCVLIGGRVDYTPLFEKTNGALYESVNAIVRNNIIASCQNDGIAVYGSSNPHILFNTIYDAGQSYGSPIDISSTLHKNGVVTPVQSPVVVNNLLLLPSSSKATMVTIGEGTNTSPSIAGTLTMDKNVYYHTGKIASFQDTRKANKFSGNIAQWKIHMNLLFSAESRSFESDPQIDTITLVPKSGSSLTGSGLNITETLSVMEDFYSNNRSGSIDIGAVKAAGSITSNTSPFPSTIFNVTMAKSGSSAVRYPPTGSMGTWWVPGYTDDVELNCTIFPKDNPWNTDISRLPVHPRSDVFIANVPRQYMHADFGTTYDGALNGIPYVIVSQDQPKSAIQWKAYADETDKVAGGYPFPEGAPIEGGPGSDGDRHVIAIDKDNCVLYETWRTFLVDRQYRDTTGGGNTFTADCGAVFDLNSNAMRPIGWTSADAAGLPIFPGLARYDEVMVQKEITHALRFTISRSQKAYIKPALHFASTVTDPNIMPMGTRLRMKSEFDCSSYSEEVQIICVGLKKYGLILADNGSDWYLSGAPHPLWNDMALNDFKKIPSNSLEVVYTGPTCLDPQCTSTRD